ncbi:hypothetical protein [Thorsellia anophelis]|uniref:Uncharacterized protein n=1 Tax=Thorsellia anophelis DSM 18579 TaxID=1123402 RepID=A0A1H9Y808_9GAMM|nr:hypothetical protein [Thorsellia anophelis]SES64950.1 hypothetical protein SAMN02583745_00108 [Thorsellia anophelis DSM 18579]
MKNKFLKTALSVSLVSIFFSSTAFAKEHTFVVEKTIKGYYPSFDSVGSTIIAGETSGLRVGDIVAVPSDVFDEQFFAQLDRDGDPALLPNSGKNYDLAWWKVTPKEGYKWSDDTTGVGTNVTNWSHVDAELINPATYLDIPQVSTSKALRVPPVKPNQRIAFSMTPETDFGDPAKGSALYAPDLNFFWGNTNPDQTPGNPDPGTENPENPNPPGDGGNPEGPNEGGGGGEIGGSEIGDAIVRIYIDRNGNGILDLGVDELLTDHPTVDTTYIADIQIVTEVDGEPVLRELEEHEKQTIQWHITNGDETVSYALNDGSNRVSDTYAFMTQTSNSDAHPTMQSLPDHYSEQGTTISISFSFDADEVAE